MSSGPCLEVGESCGVCGREQEVVVLPDFIAGQYRAEQFEHNGLEFVLTDEGERAIRVDACIVDALKAVWATETKTWASCCGHGTSNGYMGLWPIT